MATWIDSDIELRVRIAFGDTWQTASPTWTDVTDDVRGTVEIARGSGSALAEPAPATARFALDNRTRTYDPTYTSGTHYGDLLPMVPVQIDARYGGAGAYDPLFTGFVMGWPQDFMFDVDALSWVDCVDAMHILANRRLPVSAVSAVYTSDTNAQHYWPLQDTGPQTDRVGNLPLSVNPNATLATVSGTMPVGEANGVTVANNQGFFASEAPVTPNGVSFWLDADGDGTDYASVYVVSTADDYLVVLINQGRLTSLLYSNTDLTKSYELTPDLTLPLVPGGNHVAVWSDGTDINVKVNGVTCYSDTLTGSTSAYAGALGVRIVGVTAAISHLVVYSDSPTTDPYIHGRFAYGHPYGDGAATRIGRILDEIGWPAGARSLADGATVFGPWTPGGQTALDGIREVVDADRGLFFVDASGDIVYQDRRTLYTAALAPYTFEDDGTGVDYSRFRPAAVHVDNIRNVAAVTFSDGTIYRRDATSEGTYGAQQVSVSASLIESPSVATSLADYLVRAAADPSTHIEELAFDVRDSGGLNGYASAVGLTVGQPIEVDITPMGVGSQVTFAGACSQVVHSISPQQWTVSLRTVPQVPQANDVPYFQVGSVVFSRLGANLGRPVLLEDGTPMLLEDGTPFLLEASTTSNYLPY